MTVRVIHREGLAELVDLGAVTLVEALPEEVFAEAHLPGAVNIRPRRCDELAPTLLPDLDATIVVYCGSSACDASLRVARRLHELGYQDVRRYTAGKQDWISAGLPVKREAP